MIKFYQFTKLELADVIRECQAPRALNSSAEESLQWSNKMKHLLLSVVAALSVVGLAETASEKPSEKPAEKTSEKPLKVLMVGNSFSISVCKEAPKIAAAMGKKLDLASLYIGGCPLSKHANNLKGTNMQYGVGCDYCGVKKIAETPLGAVCGRNKKGGAVGNLRQVLAADKWDIVTIQQASHASWSEKTYQPYADQLIAAIRELAPQAEIRIQQTWSYCKGDSRICDRATMGPGTWGFDQTGMYERLTANYAKLAKDNGFKVIPMGLAVQKFRAAQNLADYKGDVVGNVGPDPKDPAKVRGDSIHLNSRGHYLQGLVWVGALFDADVTTCTYKPKNMSEDLAKTLRDCAAEALREGIAAGK